MKERLTETRDINWWNNFLQRSYYGADHKEWDSTVEAICREAALGAGMRVLELGSGSGQIVTRMALRELHAIGIERSDKLVESCRREAANLGALSAEFVVANMFEYQPDGLFDCVLSVNTSFGFGDDEQNYALIAKIGSWLKPGGVLYLDVCTADAAEDYGTWSDKVDGGKLTVASKYDGKHQLFTNNPSWISADGNTMFVADQPEIVRLYTRHDLETRMRSAGMAPRRLRRAMARWFVQTDRQMQTTWVATRIDERKEK